jgi:regulator of sigma E protease
MLGQDDLKPGADAEDPRAFNKKSVPQRMLVVSAGVIMNIILAAILFMVLFLYGFRAPSPVVGYVASGSPAQQAGIHTGDTILSFNGQPQQDFTKITLNTALASTDEPLRIKVRRVNGTEETLDVQPVRPEGASKSFLALGIGGPTSLEGLKAKDYPDAPANPDLEPVGRRAMGPEDVIIAVNGEPVSPSDIYKPNEPGDAYKLDQAVQKSHGKPVELTIKRRDGKVETVALPAHFEPSFLQSIPTVSIGGMQPRMRVEFIANDKSPVLGKFKPGDVVQSIEVRNAGVATSQPGDRAPDVSVGGFIETVGRAGQKDQTLDFVLLRDGQSVEVKGIKASVKLGKDRDNNDRFGVGVAPGFEDQTPVIASVVKNSPAANVKDGLPTGALITAVNGAPVKSWHDVRDVFQAKSGDNVLTLQPADGGKPIERTLTLNDTDRRAVADIRLALPPLLLKEQIVVRQTSNPATAMGWGVLETRDLILQFYVTLQRMFGGSVSPSNLKGPLGIVNAGTKFAFKGTDWLIWFLAMISANLAVVNFLPIPIVDGGLFLFLIIEKIQGRPLSRRTQEYAQVFGLLLILGVFAMVTFNDISRMFGH